jgi:hypothetical protein
MPNFCNQFCCPGVLNKNPSVWLDGTRPDNIYIHPPSQGMHPYNGKEATINRGLNGSSYSGLKLVHSIFGKINYGGLKHNSLYLGLVLRSGG